MGLGPPVCTKCMVIAKLNENDIRHPWRCPVCKDWDIKGSLFTYVHSLQEILWKRTNFVSKKSVATKIKHAHVAKRPFMDQGHPEPNEHYRPWMEEHIGKQGIAWDWDLSSDDFTVMEIYFVTQEHATLFELTWP